MVGYKQQIFPSMGCGTGTDNNLSGRYLCKRRKSGAKAAEIHTAGSGGGYSSTPVTMYPEGAKAGRLFIGTYNWSDKKETVTTGHSFASRPYGMKFWYKYTPYQTDNFKVEIEIRSGNKVIAGGSYISEAASSADSEYQEAYINLDYQENMEKATDIYVNILSTTKPLSAVTIYRKPEQLI